MHIWCRLEFTQRSVGQEIFIILKDKPITFPTHIPSICIFIVLFVHHSWSLPLYWDDSDFLPSAYQSLIALFSSFLFPFPPFKPVYHQLVIICDIISLSAMTEGGHTPQARHTGFGKRLGRSPQTINKSGMRRLPAAFSQNALGRQRTDDQWACVCGSRSSLDELSK